MSIIKDLIAAAKVKESNPIQPGILDGTLSAEQLTHGPEENNLGGKYMQGDGAWDIKFIDKLSPDVLLLFSSRMAQMYQHTNQHNLTQPMTRQAKDILLKERYPVHQLSTVLS